MPTRTPATRILLVILAVLVGLALIAWGALAWMFPPARVHALVAAQLQRTFTRPVRFGDVGVALWPPVRLHASDLAVAEPGGFGAGTAAQLSRLDLDLDAWALLRRTLVVRRLQLEQPALHLVLRPDGHTNLENLMAPAPARRGTPMDLDVRALEVRGGSVLVDDLGAHRRISFGLDSRLAFASRQGGRALETSGHTEVSRLAFGPLEARRVQDLDQAFAKLTWSLDHAGRFEQALDRLTLDRLALAFGGTTLDVHGTVDHPGARPVLALRARGAGVDLAGLLHFLAAADARMVKGIEGGGRASFDLAVSGALAPGRLPDVTGSAAVSDLHVHYPGAPADVEGVAFHARFTPDQVEIPDLAARIEGQPVRAQIAVQHFADPSARVALQGQFDLAVVAPLVAPKNTKLTGHAGVNVTGSGRVKDPGAWNLDGRAELTNGTLETPSLPRKLEGLAAVAQFSPARATLRGLVAHAGSSSFRLDGDVGRPLALLSPIGKAAPATLQFTFASPYLDLADLVPPGPGGPIHLNATGTGRVTIDRLKNQKLDVRNVALDIGVEPDVFTIPSFAVQAYGGTVRGQARIGFAGGGPSYSVKGTADKVQADQFLSAWTPVRGLLTGVVTSNFDVSGNGTTPVDARRTLSAIGLASFLDGQLNGPVLSAIAQATRTPALANVSLRDLKLPFRVVRGQVLLDSLHLSGAAGDWRGSGLVGFDGALDWALAITLPKEVAQRVSLAPALAAGALTDAQGRVIMDLHVTGNARRPSVAWNTQSMRERVTGRVSSALVEQKQKLKEDLLRQAGLARRDSAAAFSADSLRRISTRSVGQAVQQRGRELLQGFFGRGKKPPDTTAADSSKH